MDTNKLVRMCKDYFARCGYSEKNPNGLLHPSYPDTYNPCSGHAEITKLAHSLKLENPVNWTVLEPVFRHLDAQKVGVSRHHSSFFEMLTYVDARNREQASKEKIILEQLGLYRELSINIKKLQVTTFDGYELFDKKIPADEESRSIWTKLLGKSKVHALRSTSNIEFWPQEGEQAGPRCEIFIEKNVQLLEIGTVVFDNHIYSNGSFKGIPNSIYGGASGIERLEMAVNGYSSIREVGTIRKIDDTLREYSQAGNLRFLEDELITASDGLKSGLLITAEGQEKTNKTRRGQRLSRLISDTKRALERLNIRDYGKICLDVAHSLEEMYGEKYEFYRKINPERMIEYLRATKLRE